MPAGRGTHVAESRFLHHVESVCRRRQHVKKTCRQIRILATRRIDRPFFTKRRAFQARSVDFWGESNAGEGVGGARRSAESFQLNTACSTDGSVSIPSIGARAVRRVGAFVPILCRPPRTGA